MKIKNSFSEISKLKKAKSLNYAISVRNAQRSWLEGEYDRSNMSAIRTSFSSPIRYCQDEWVSSPLTNAAKKHIQKYLGITLDYVTYTERGKLNKMLKAVNAEELWWEHVTGVKSISEDLMNSELVKSAEDMIEFIAERTLIVVKLKHTEKHINHNTTIEQLNIWNNSQK